MTTRTRVGGGLAGLAAAAMGWLGAGCAPAEASAVDHRKLVAEGARLVDVRTPEEFASGHVEGAVNIPVQELDRRLGELAPKDRAVVLYCRSGARSARAAETLKAEGFTAVHDIGPMSRW